MPLATQTPELSLEANFLSLDSPSLHGNGPNGEVKQRPMFYEFKPEEIVKAAHGSTLRCKTWEAEAALRMLENNLDPAVSLVYDELIVYGGAGRAARNWKEYQTIVKTLKELEADETMLVQSGKAAGVLRTWPHAPRVLIANSNLVPAWSTQEYFDELDKMGLMMYGQMTAGSWIYIATQGILQGTYETFAAMAEQHFGGSLRGTVTVTAGLGGMSGAQPLVVTMNDGVCLVNANAGLFLPSVRPDAAPQSVLRTGRQSSARGIPRCRRVRHLHQLGKGDNHRLDEKRCPARYPVILTVAGAVLVKLFN